VDILFRDPDRVPEHVGEDLRQPRPAGEHELVPGPAPARRVDDVDQPIALDPTRLGRGLLQGHTLGHGARGGRRHAAAGKQEPALRLEHREGEAVDRDPRPARRHLCRREPLDGNAEAAQRQERGGLEPVLPPGEPQGARLDEDRLADRQAEDDPRLP
jgi:hypothetical protein